MKKFILFSCLMLSTCTLGKAQFIDRELVSPASGFFEDNTIQMTWVIGDLVVGDLAYPVIIDPFVNLPRLKVGPSSVTVFPNPTTDKVFLVLDMDDIEKFTKSSWPSFLDDSIRFYIAFNLKIDNIIYS